MGWKENIWVLYYIMPKSKNKWNFKINRDVEREIHLYLFTWISVILMIVGGIVHARSDNDRGEHVLYTGIGIAGLVAIGLVIHLVKTEGKLVWLFKEPVYNY